MATARTINRLISAILVDILHVYRSDEAIGTTDKESVLYAIQDRLISWADHVAIPVITSESLSMVVGTASYTIGESGVPSLDTTRPETIVSAYVQVGDYDHPVKIIPATEYYRITDKTISGRPIKLFPDYTTPNITIYLHPVPDSTDTLYIQSVKPYTEPTAYTTDTYASLYLPGYIYNALKWRVAIDVAPGYERQLTPEVTFNAQEAYSNMIAKHLARSMTGGVVEMAHRRGRGSYSLADFFAGE